MSNGSPASITAATTETMTMMVGTHVLTTPATARVLFACYGEGARDVWRAARP